MPTKTSKNSSPKPGQKASIAQAPELTPEELQELSALGINPSLIDAVNDVPGIGSASGPADKQAEIDDWIANGGKPV